MTIKEVNIPSEEININKHIVLLKWRDGNIYTLQRIDREFSFRKKGQEEVSTAIPYWHSEVLIDDMIRLGGEIKIFEILV